jgi:hypothetical protein
VNDPHRLAHFRPVENGDDGLDLRRHGKVLRAQLVGAYACIRGEQLLLAADAPRWRIRRRGHFPQIAGFSSLPPILGGVRTEALERPNAALFGRRVARNEFTDYSRTGLAYRPLRRRSGLHGRNFGGHAGSGGQLEPRLAAASSPMRH